MKKFTKRFLKEVLQFNKEEIELTMEVQRKFPELLVNEGEYIESARKLYLELGLTESNYSKWYKKNIINNEFFLKDKDWYEVLVQSTKTSDTNTLGGRPTKDFKITLDFAKHLSMMQRTENSHKIRCYFILIEKAIRGMQNHLEVREPEKKGYNDLCDFVKQWAENNLKDYDLDGLYQREANMLNQCLFGMKASEIQLMLGYTDRVTREHLEIEHNKALYNLQLVDSSLLMANLDFETRKRIIKDTCNNKYSELYIKK